MKNVEERPTRITNHSKTLINLIVTNRKDLVKQEGTCPLGISDHDMIDAALSASIPRDPPKIITIRNFNKFSERNFQSDIARAPFQVCEVFDDPTDVYYAWNLLFTELCNEHAPLKQIKVRSNSLPWITKEIRITMNQRYKTLKRARQLNDPLLWDDYRRLRNKVSTMTKKSQSRLLLQFIRWSKIRCCLLETTEKDIRNIKSKQTSPPIKEERWNPYNRWHWKGNYVKRLLLHSCWKLIGPADHRKFSHYTPIAVRM